jgi:predicted NBD/HSP70 family sugar kinase
MGMSGIVQYRLENVNNIMAPTQHKRYNEAMYIGVDIGGSKILVVAGNNHHHIVRQQKIETPDTAAQGVAEIIHLIEQICANDPIEAIFVASPGPIDRQRGRILKTPNMAWQPVDIVKQLHNHFRVPVGLEKDANAAALSEAILGSAKGKKYVLYVTVSTGIGTGIIIDGQIYHGAHDPEGGHIDIAAEGGNEELETAASGKALKRRFGQYGYQIQDADTWDQFAYDLALGLHNLITTISPEVVVLGGGVGVHFKKFNHFLLKHLEDLKPLYPTPPIVPAENMETAVAYGALILASRLPQKALSKTP